MGRGNVCVTGKYEGLFYIDNDDLDLYYAVNDDDAEEVFRKSLNYEDLTSGEWELDTDLTRLNWDDVVYNFTSAFTKRFPSFSICSKWMDKYRDATAIMENNLFWVAVEDNEWSVAVKLIQKEDPYDNHLEGLQKRHYQRYLDGIRDALFEQFDELGTYAGAWTSGCIKRATV